MLKIKVMDGEEHKKIQEKCYAVMKILPDDPEKAMFVLRIILNGLEDFTGNILQDELKKRGQE